MITSFDTGNDQLRRLDEQAELMRLAGEETNQPVVIAAAEILEKAKLESYLELCEVVGADPNLVRFCRGALSRVELVIYVVDRQAEAEQVSPSTHLGQLAVSASSEESELMAFFELFAPDDETFLRYKETRAASQARPQTIGFTADSAGPTADASETLEDETAEQLDAATQQSDSDGSDAESEHEAVEPASSEVESEMAEAEVPTDAIDEAGIEVEATPADVAVASNVATTEASLEGQSLRVANKILINGAEATLNKVTTLVLQIMHELGGKGIKSETIIADPRFLNAMEKTSKTALSHSSIQTRIYSTFRKLEDTHPGLTFKSGSSRGPGAMRNLNDDYTLEFVFDDQPTDKVAGNGEAVTADNEHTASPAVETDESAGLVNPVAEQPTTPVIASTDSIRARFASIQSRAEATTTIELTPQMTSRTKLVTDGYMIDGRRTDFTDEERELVRCISDSPRKAPIAPASLAESLRGRNGSGSLSAEEVDSILTDLSSRLPKGWLVKIPGARPEQPAGWRFASRIGIKQQGRKAKKDSAK